MKILKYVLIGVVIALVIAVVGRNFIIKSAAQTGVQAVTGLKLEIGDLNVGLFSSDFSMTDFKLHNPDEFAQDPIMLAVPEVYVDYSLADLIAGKVHFAEIRFHLKEFLVVKNEDGVLNLDHLKALAAKPKDGAQEKAVEEKEVPAETTEKAPMDFKVDELFLRVDKVVYKTYKDGKASTKAFKIGLNETMKNITDPNALVQLITYKALFTTTISNLAGFDLGGLGSTLGGTLGTATNVGKKTVDQATGLLKGLGGSLKSLGDTVGETVK